MKIVLNLRRTIFVALIPIFFIQGLEQEGPKNNKEKELEITKQRIERALNGNLHDETVMYDLKNGFAYLAELEQYYAKQKLAGNAEQIKSMLDDYHKKLAEDLNKLNDIQVKKMHDEYKQKESALKNLVQTRITSLPKEKITSKDLYIKCINNFFDEIEQDLSNSASIYYNAYMNGIAFFNEQLQGYLKKMHIGSGLEKEINTIFIQRKRNTDFIITIKQLTGMLRQLNNNSEQLDYYKTKKQQFPDMTGQMSVEELIKQDKITNQNVQAIFIDLTYFINEVTAHYLYESNTLGLNSPYIQSVLQQNKNVMNKFDIGQQEQIKAIIAEINNTLKSYIAHSAVLFDIVYEALIKEESKHKQILLTKIAQENFRLILFVNSFIHNFNVLGDTYLINIKTHYNRKIELVEQGFDSKLLLQKLKIAVKGKKHDDIYLYQLFTDVCNEFHRYINVQVFHKASNLGDLFTSNEQFYKQLVTYAQTIKKQMNAVTFKLKMRNFSRFINFDNPLIQQYIKENNIVIIREQLERISKDEQAIKTILTSPLIQDMSIDQFIAEKQLSEQEQLAVTHAFKRVNNIFNNRVENWKQDIGIDHPITQKVLRNLAYAPEMRSTMSNDYIELDALVESTLEVGRSIMQELLVLLQLIKGQYARSKSDKKTALKIVASPCFSLLKDMAKYFLNTHLVNYTEGTSLLNKAEESIKFPRK